MPIISTFFGILIKMFHNDHNPPHFHVEYGDDRAIVEISSGRLLAGGLPTRVHELVKEWRRLHVDELRKAWQDAQAARQPRRIRPLE